MQRFGSHEERRTRGVQRQLLEVIDRLSGQDLVDHEGLVAPPGSLQLPGGGEPQLGLALHAACPPPCPPRAASAPPAHCKTRLAARGGEAAGGEGGEAAGGAGSVGDLFYVGDTACCPSPRAAAGPHRRARRPSLSRSCCHFSTLNIRSDLLLLLY